MTGTPPPSSFSVVDILTTAGLAPDSIAKFITFHPRLTVSKFQRALRRLHNCEDTTTYLMPVGLTDADVWDWLDSATMVGLASWFAQSSDTGGPMFNWSSELDGDSFALYLSNKSSPSNPPTLPTVTAPIHPGPSSPSCPPSPSPPPGYIHSYHVDLLLADSKDLACRSGTSAATNTLAPHPLWTSTQISSAITIDKKTFLFC